jgi:hypothetical protein
VTSDSGGGFAPLTGAFRVNGFGAKLQPRELEIDTRDLPEGARLALRIPEEWFFGLKAFEVPVRKGRRAAKIGAALQDVPAGDAAATPVPISALAGEPGPAPVPSKLRTRGKKPEARASRRSVRIPAGRVIRFVGLTPTGKDRIELQFELRFPRGTGPRDVTLAFRERCRGGLLGQMNYVFMIRGRRRSPE